MYDKLTIRDLEVDGLRVLVRVDFNVPLDDGGVADDTRIRESLPTLRYLLERGCRIILVSHLGRPGGQVQEDLRLDPVARRLADLLACDVVKVDQVTGPEVDRAAAGLPAPGVLLLENVRFDPREEAGDDGLARELAALADLYVNDAFGAAHRAHASTTGVARFLPAAAGLLMARELEVLGGLVARPDRPFWAVVGGAKISDKLGVLKSLIKHCDGLILGGGMANTFLAARGLDLGESLVEADMLAEAGCIAALARETGRDLLLPEDLVVASEFKPDAEYRVCPVDRVPPGWRALDVGPASVAAFGRALARARTVFWNGPLGVCEWEAFAAGTVAMARQLAGLDATVVVGGGDSVAAVHRAGVAGAVSHISTGGGAALELVEGRTLPGVAALGDREGKLT